MEEPISFYDALAENYHLIFEDWDRSIQRQANVLGPLLERELTGKTLRILDCACGIGTQSLGLASRGHEVVGSDLSMAAVARARREALQRGYSIVFQQTDMRNLAVIPQKNFDAIIAADNALPHLHEDDELELVAHEIFTKLRPGGLFLASIRDYDQLTVERPAVQIPSFFRNSGFRRIVHQVWDWIDERRYVLHLYLTCETVDGWECQHYVSPYRALLRHELTMILERGGFTEIRWIMPAETEFYQPIILARRPGPR